MEHNLLTDKKHIHFIGIGGIGMSALAHILLELGYKVSGSDLKPTSLIQRLESNGAKVFIGHDAENIDGSELVVYSSAIDASNPEILSAKEKGKTVISRAKLLSCIMADRIGIAITGAHGKTTTTALITQMLVEAGLDPTFAIGAEVEYFKGNARLGKGNYIVTEADESDGSFLLLSPKYSVITNIDREHMDYYGDMETLVRAFKGFVNQIPHDGVVFGCYDDVYVREIMQGKTSLKLISYGLSPEAHIHPSNIVVSGFTSSYECVYQGRVLGKVELSIPGIHNISNSLAAIGIGIELNIPFDVIRGAILHYKGANRRFQMQALLDKTIIIDDYAHHPTEIRATLSAVMLGKNANSKVVVIFQPHRYTRTRDLKDAFADAFIGADIVVITDIYPAFEQAIEGISGKTIYERATAAGHNNFSYLPKYSIVDYLDKILNPGDTVVILGAGDIWEIADDLARRLHERRNIKNTN